MKLGKILALIAAIFGANLAQAANPAIVADGLKTLVTIARGLNETANLDSVGERRIIEVRVQGSFDWYFIRAEQQGLSAKEAAQALQLAVDAFEQAGGGGDAKQFVIDFARMEIAKYGVERDI